MSGLDVMAAAVEVETFCRARGWRFCFIGGIAVQRWGMPRFTQDVDATVLADIGGEEAIVDAILAHFPARRANARTFAIAHRVVLARTIGGVPLDLALGCLDFEVRSVARATQWKLSDGNVITTLTAEDLVVHKVFAGRDRDWGDVESIMTRQHGKLELEQIRRELAPLLELKGDVAPLGKLEHLVAAVDARLAR